MYKNALCGIICESRKLETNRKPTTSRMDTPLGCTHTREHHMEMRTHIYRRMELTVRQGHSADWKINRVKSARQRRAYTIRLLHLYTIQNTENKFLQLESRKGAALGVEVRGGEAVTGRDPERAGGRGGMGGWSCSSTRSGYYFHW